MSKFKRVISLAAALAVLFVMTFSSVPANAEGTGKITVTPPEGGDLTGVVFKAYKILNITGISGDGENYTATIPDDLLEVYRSLGTIGGVNFADSDEETIVKGIAAWKSDDNAENLNKFAIAMLKALKSDSYKSKVTPVSGNPIDNNIEFTNLDFGYYLIAEDFSAELGDDVHEMADVMLTPVDKEVTVTAKLETEPEIEKKIVVPKPDTDYTNQDHTLFPNHSESPADGTTDFTNVFDAWDAQRGEGVLFRLDITLPDTALQDFTKDTYKLIVKDNLSKGLTLETDAADGFKKGDADNSKFLYAGMFVDISNGQGHLPGDDPESPKNSLISDGVLQAGTEWYSDKVCNLVYQSGDYTYGSTAFSEEAPDVAYTIKKNDDGTTDIEFDLSKLAYYFVHDAYQQDPLQHGGKPHYYGRGKKVVILYYAQLNDDAVIGDKGNPNDVYLTYSHDPSVDTSKPENLTDTPKDYVDVFTFGLNPQKILGGSEETKPLSGAKFKMYTLQQGIDGDYKKMYFNPTNEQALDGVGTVKTTQWTETAESAAEFETDSEGRLKLNDDLHTLSGLEAGTYYFEETQTPSADYKDLPGVIKVLIQPKSKGEITQWEVIDDGTNNIDYKDSESEHHYDVAVTLVEKHDDSASDDQSWKKKGSEADKTIVSGNYVTDAKVVNDTPGKPSDNYGEFEIANILKGAPDVNLPQTGGRGTGFLYVIGALLIIGAGILLVTKKRMSR